MASNYQFVSADASEIVDRLTASYEKLCGITVQPASPERLFILWIADVIEQTYAVINIAANQNIPSRAAGSNLDALAELVWAKERPDAQKATCTVLFEISEAQVSAILIPAGTRVTDASRTLFWATQEDVYIPIGATSAEVPVYCETAGAVGNDYFVGQINTIVDLFPYYSSCTNITVSGGGSDAATDEEFYEILRASMDAYSTAGPVGAYTYWAKSVSTEIADVKAIRPKRAVEKTIPVYAGHAFLGGDNLDLSTLVVSEVGGSAPARAGTDYTATYIDGLLDISIIDGGALASAEQLKVEITADGAGCVEIYALMEDGTPAPESVKALILAACNDDTIRPLTDSVSVKDPRKAVYDIDIMYYLSRDASRSASEIEAAVNAAVEEYKAWQCAKLGRDINPSKLVSLLMNTGVKRVEVRQPLFVALSDGSDNVAPQIATFGQASVASGGYEDE